jgi:hypothetical protein
MTFTMIVVPAQAGTHNTGAIANTAWVPACAGTTVLDIYVRPGTCSRLSNQ